MKTALAALMMMGVVGIGAAAGLGLPKAHAETGTHPHLDILCYNPAFASSGPTSTLNGGDPIKVPLVGLRAQNDYCSGPDVVLPPDYGSGAAAPIVVPPPTP